MRTRTVTLADLDQVVDLFWACWTRSYPAFASPEELACLDLDQARRLWHDALTGPGEGLVLDDGQRLVAMTRWRREGDLVEVGSLYVHPDAQRQGLGARLLQAATAGAREARLWVFSANQAARDFYAAQGWLPDGISRTEPAYPMPQTRLVREPALSLAGLAEQMLTRRVCVTAAETPPRAMVLATSDHGTCAAGVRNLAGDPVSTSTWFDLASVTKLVTTVALIQLVSRGQVDLDAPAGRYWAPAGDLVVRDLLTHRSGLLPWQPLYLLTQDRDQALLAALAQPRQAPGVRRYSDLSFQVLGETVAQVAGEPLPGAIRRLVCEPLGVDLRYGPDLPADAEIASGALDDRVEQRMIATGEPYPVIVSGSFTGWRTSEVVGQVADGNAYHALGGVSGHAGLFATVPQLLRLGEQLARPTVLDPATVSLFCQDGPDQGQALGFRTQDLPDGRQLVYHPGYTGCSVGFIPDGAAVAVGCNRLLTDGEPVPNVRLLEHLVAMMDRLR